MATLRELFMKIVIDPKGAVDGLDDVDKAADKTEKGLRKVDKETLKVGETFKEFGSRAATGLKVAAAAFAGATVAVGVFFSRFAESSLQIDRASKAYGISTDALQELTFAAEKLGGEGDAVIEVFKEMAIRITEVAETGTGPATDALTLLKLKASDLKKLRPEEQFNVLADAMAKVSDEGTKFFLKDSLFGEEGGIKIGTLLDNGSEGIAKMREEARALGVVLSKDAIEAGIKFRSTLFTIEKRLEGVSNKIAVKMLPRVQKLAEKLLGWAEANKDIIASKLESFIENLVKLATQLIPLISKVVDKMAELTDKVGGMDNALAIAAGGWAAWQFAALAAIGPVGAALAALAGGMAIGAFVGNYAQSYVDDLNKLRANETAAFNKAGRLLNAPNSGLPEEQEARADLEQQLVNFGLLTQLDTGKLRSDEMQADITAQLAEIDRATSGVEAFTGLPAMGPSEPTPLEAAKSFKLGKIAKPGAGGEKPITLEQLLKDARKENQTLDRYREIRKQLEAKLLEVGIASREEIATAMRAGEASPAGKAARERLIIEGALKGVNQKLGQAGETQNLNDLIASAVGQGTGLGASRLQPAGLGTSIMHIDASVKFEVGGITVEVPAGMAAAYTGAVKIGGDVAEAARNVLGEMVENAFRAQRGQIIG